MTVEAERAILFDCEECGETQFHEYSLEHGWHEDRVVFQDNIICESCQHENHVIEEL